jgi:hypothetical protein
MAGDASEALGSEALPRGTLAPRPPRGGATARGREAARRSARPATGHRAALADAAAAFVVSRVLVWVAGIAAIAVAGLSPRRADFDPAGLTAPFGAAGDLLVGPAARWDSVWSLAIAAEGYGTSQAKPAFFPLYPLLAELAGLPLRSTLLGGILVSSASLAGALYLLRRLTELELGPAAARHAVWLTALFPLAFFHSAVYAEGLFLLLSVGAVYAARRDCWAWAGVLGGLAAATRSAGVVLLVALALLHLRAHPRPTRDVAWLALVPLGLGAFCAWLWWRGLGWTASFEAQSVWLRDLGAPFSAVPPAIEAAWAGLRQLLSGSREVVFFPEAGGDPLQVARMNLMLLGFLVLGAAALVGALRRLPAAYGLYALAALALPLSTPVGPQPLMSLPRFEAVLFPLFMWAGWWVSRRSAPARLGVYATSAALLALFAGLFATWRWVA